MTWQNARFGPAESAPSESAEPAPAGEHDGAVSDVLGVAWRTVAFGWRFGSALVHGSHCRRRRRPGRLRGASSFQWASPPCPGRSYTRASARVAASSARSGGDRGRRWDRRRRRAARTRQTDRGLPSREWEALLHAMMADVDAAGSPTRPCACPRTHRCCSGPGSPRPRQQAPALRRCRVRRTGGWMTVGTGHTVLDPFYERA